MSGVVAEHPEVAAADALARMSGAAGVGLVQDQGDGLVIGGFEDEAQVGIGRVGQGHRDREVGEVGGRIEAADQIGEWRGHRDIRRRRRRRD